MDDVDGSGGGLQFDRAEYEGREERAVAPAVPCGLCGQSIADSYYKVNAGIVCRGCHAKVLAARGAGGGFGRFFRALFFGLSAGAVGAAIYYAVLAATGYEVGLIAIVVGFLVGIAVQVGSRQRGGWLYQGLAMAITYVAIVTTYVPFVLEELRNSIADANQQTAPLEPERGALGEEASDSETAAGAGATELGAAGEVLVVVFAFVLAFVAPFMMGFDNVLGLVIIGIALYEAWKINKRQPFAAEGPFQVGVQPA